VRELYEHDRLLARIEQTRGAPERARIHIEIPSISLSVQITPLDSTPAQP
jgi:hypothetical protein